MRMVRLLGRAAILAVVLTLPGSVAHAQIRPLAGTCGGETNPCLPKIYLSNSTFSGVSRPPESGPYTYTFQVTNNGQASGLYTADCLQTPAQLSCSTNPSDFSLAKGSTRTVTVTFSTKGLGKFTLRQLVRATASGVLADTDTLVADPIRVSGIPIATHFFPLDQGSVGSGDTLGASLSHTSG